MSKETRPSIPPELMSEEAKKHWKKLNRKGSDRTITKKIDDIGEFEVSVETDDILAVNNERMGILRAKDADFKRAIDKIGRTDINPLEHRGLRAEAEDRKKKK